jgi:hypothetical protein
LGGAIPVESAERELDCGVEIEIGSSRPRFLDPVSQLASHGAHCVAQQLSLVQFQFEAMLPSQRLVCRAETSGGVRITMR